MLAPLPQASQSKHKLEPQAQPGSAPQLHPALGPGTLVPVEEDWHPVSPDISRDPHLSKHILPQQELREQEQVVKSFPAQALHLACQRLLGHWQGLFSAASAELGVLGFRTEPTLPT